MVIAVSINKYDEPVTPVLRPKNWTERKKIIFIKPIPKKEI
jgi:hypothetical protein